MKELIRVWIVGILAMSVILVAQKPEVKEKAQQVQYAASAMAVPAGLFAATGALLVFSFKTGIFD